MHSVGHSFKSSRIMFGIMGSGPIILFICSAITAAIAHPYGHQELLTAQNSDGSLDYRNIELRPITYRKHFHFFAAPEEDDSFDEQIPEELLKKNVNVVVIKTPENNKATAMIARLAKALAEEKTSIYVLNKEPDLKEITAQIERLKEQDSTRPDVHFIKYKTSEEADLAARNIQVEYDSLRGPSVVGPQVMAALHNYVGLLDGGGIQEMRLVSFYGRPLLNSFLKSTSESGTKGDVLGEPLPSSSFYLPPEADASNPSEPSTPIEENASSFDNASKTSPDFYLPPEIDSETPTSSAAEVSSEESAPTAISEAPLVEIKQVKNAASARILNPHPEATTEEASTTSPETSSLVSTKNAGRGSFRYSHSKTTTEISTHSLAGTSALDDVTFLSGKYLPPSESKFRNKRLK